MKQTTRQGARMAATRPRTLPRQQRLEELVLRAVEHERLSSSVYRAALECIDDDATRAKWTERLRQTMRNMAIAAALCCELQIDMDQQMSDCLAVRKLASALVAAMQAAKDEGAPEKLDRIARECVGIAESKTQFDWSHFVKPASPRPGASMAHDAPHASPARG